MTSTTDADRKARIVEQVDQLVREFVAIQLQPSDNRFGEQHIPYAGRVYDAEEVVAGVRSMLDFWLTLGPEGAKFERELAEYLGVRTSILANSGSSANLLAFAALTSHKLGDRRLKPGDEVITVAGGFPTTISPVIQYGCVPVFLDNDPATGNLRIEQLEDAYCERRTKAVFMAHTLGNPFDLTAVTQFCAEHDLWLIEDNCDALGSQYGDRLTGTFGDLSTQSFYPPHHLTLGEGGAVNVVSDVKLKALVESFRDWGRDCWCASGCDNTCGKRFAWDLGELPTGYDHKFVYSHLGYNLKPLDPQAAIGRVQLRKLPGFIEARRRNWSYLRQALAPAEEFFDFMLPTHATAWTPDGFRWEPGKPQTDPSWFGFLLLIKPTAPFTRTDVARELERLHIGNRMLFGGNLVRQPALVQLKRQYDCSKTSASGPPFRVIGNLSGADELMNQALFVGVYPGLSDEALEFVSKALLSYCRRQAGLRAA